MIIRTSPRGKGSFRGNTHECVVLQDLLTSTAAVSEYSVCATPVRLNVQKDVDTVPRRIKLSIKVAVNTIVPRPPFFAFCTPKPRLLHT